MSFHNLPYFSMWGKIQHCKEIGDNIYSVITAGHGGIMIPTDIAKQILSNKALINGVVEDGYIQYEKYAKEINLKDIEKYGKYWLPEYFGNYLPPIESPTGDIKNIYELSNGVFLIENDNGLELAVHKEKSKYMRYQNNELGDYKYFREFNPALLDRLCINENSDIKHKIQQITDDLGVDSPVIQKTIEKSQNIENKIVAEIEEDEELSI
jgi:hypothetical protein